MPDEKKQAANNEEPKKKLPLKTLIVLGVVFLIEALVISGAFLLTQPAESVAELSGAEKDELAQKESIVEVLVCEGKFNNTRRGPIYMYDVEVAIGVKRKYEEEAVADSERLVHRIKDVVRSIVAGAEPAQLNEEDLTTIKRQIREHLEQFFGKDDEGNSVIESIMITKWNSYRQGH